MSAANATLRARRLPPDAPRAPVRHGWCASNCVTARSCGWLRPSVPPFYLTTYRSVIALPALWDLRAATALRSGVAAFAPFVAGAAAWMGSRDGRLATGELVAARARSRWSTRTATWAATTCWATAIYLVCTGVIYGVTASQATWGGPPVWPVVVGVCAVAALAAVGFVAGAVMPSRFTAPLAAAVALLVVEAPAKVQLASDPIQLGFTGSPYALLSPTSHVPLPYDAGVFFRFSTGVEVLGDRLRRVGGDRARCARAARRRGRAWSRRAAVLLPLLGLAGVSTGVGLVGTARLTSHGVEIPALSSTADDRPIRYTPACRLTAATPVCVHPVFKPYLSQITVALAPLLHEIAGLPGAPVRAVQIADLGIDSQTSVCYYARHDTAGIGGGIGGSLSGTPPVFHFFVVQLPGTNRLSAGAFAGDVQLTLVQALTGDGCGNDPAQLAIRAALLRAAGLSLAPLVQNSGRLPASAEAAAMRFAYLSAATRHAWLQRHLGALAAGRLTTAQIP